MQFGGANGFDAAIRVRHQCDVLKARVAPEGNDVLDQVVEIVPARRLLRLPKTTPREADATMAREELRREVTEDMRGAAQTRQEQ